MAFPLDIDKAYYVVELVCGDESGVQDFVEFASKEDCNFHKMQSHEFNVIAYPELEKFHRFMRFTQRSGFWVESIQCLR